MVIGFKQQFKDPILAGIKLHTIRADVHDRWRPGMMMHMATGTRSKHYNCFATELCLNVQRITMRLFNDELEIMIGNRMLDRREKELLALNDGFESLNDFEKWWLPELAKQHGLFTGKIIHWTPSTYR